MKGFESSVREYEKQLAYIMRNQCREKESPDFGGYYNVGFGTVSSNCGIDTYIPITLYYCKESRYYKDPGALACALDLLDYLLSHLNEDGTVDYFLCNFHSAPDTAFVTLNLARAAKLVTVENEAEQKLQDQLMCALQRMGEGMVQGGFHTPNHRWVISAALAMLYRLMPSQSYLDKMESYLAEGIDCSRDGEYTERSAGGYNEINNRAMIVLYQELGDRKFMECVQRNLHLMLAFFHSDLSIFTENSTRQDKGKKVYADKYLFQYLYCGYVMQDRVLVQVGMYILEDCLRCGRRFQVSPDYFMLYPEAFGQDIVPVDKSVFGVTRHLKESGVLRLSVGNMNLWVLEKHAEFLFVRCGSIDFYIKGGINFFDCRHLLMENLRETEKGYRMEFTGTGCYRMPFGAFQGSSKWEEMDHEKREHTPKLTVRIVTELAVLADGVQIRMYSEGCTKATVRLEIGVLPNVTVEGNEYHMKAVPGGMMTAKSGTIRISDGYEAVHISPAFAKNQVMTGLRGSVPPAKDRFNIIFNDVTNMDHTFTIRESKEGGH